MNFHTACKMRVWSDWAKRGFLPTSWRPGCRPNYNVPQVWQTIAVRPSDALQTCPIFLDLQKLWFCDASSGRNWWKIRPIAVTSEAESSCSGITLLSFNWGKPWWKLWSQTSRPTSGLVFISYSTLVWWKGWIWKGGESPLMEFPRLGKQIKLTCREAFRHKIIIPAVLPDKLCNTHIN